MKKLLLIFGVVIALCAFLPIASEGQIILRSSHSLPSDTVSNTGTAYLQGRVTGSGSIAVQVEITKISGTVAGTVSLFGSIDGVNYRSISSTTYTATDVASQGVILKDTYVYTPYYRVTWTGTGTMAASFTAKALVRPTK